ncbi:MAG TPA: radical SAM protein [Candidatus Acidoferrum sp.]|jgi:DNA repair photolyase
MSPVLSSTSPAGFPIRRPAVRSSASLFPDCPDRSPNTRTSALAPQAGSGSIVPDHGGSACPPGLPSFCEDSLRIEDFRKDAALAAPGAVIKTTAPLVGIARLASISPAAATRRKSDERPEYFLLPVKSVLNKCESGRVPFDWTINPYRGCEFACKYCYARYTHEFMELDGLAFEKKIFVKKDAAVLLTRDIATKYSFAKERTQNGDDVPEHICIGTATDPYQPAEKEFGVTRACLEELARHPGLSLSIVTKSNLISRDIDVLQEIAKHSRLHVDMTITTLRPRLARMMEPRAPRPDLRLAAVRKLRDAGISAGVLASPLLPGITDREGELESLAAAAKEAGALWFSSGVLFLMPSSAKQFLPFLREKFPRLIRQYESWYSRNAYPPESYRQKVAARVSRIKSQFGFNVRPWANLRQPVAPAPQLSFAL